MTAGSIAGSIPMSDNGRPVLALWNDATGQVVPVHAGTLIIGADGKSYARLDMVASVATSALFTAAQTTVGNGNSGDLDVSRLREIAIDLTTTAQAGTNPTLQFFWERKAADGNYYVLWQSSILTVASNTLSTSIGPGLAYNQSLGATGRLRWVVGGTATPTWTFTTNVQGK
jgi:hypothetical protein